MRIKHRHLRKITKSLATSTLKISKHKSEGEKCGRVQLWISEFEATKSHEFPPFLKKTSPARQLEWLRSQIIGNHIECLTPFGKRLIHYADHTASGRSLMFIEKYILQHVLPIYGNTHTDDSFVGQRMTQLVEEASAYVKGCLGATDSDAIFFCGTGSTAAIKRLQEIMGLAVAPSLRNQTLETVEEKSRWVVFVGPYEHHSNLLSWRQSMAEVVEIPLGKDGFMNMDELRSALQNPKYGGRPKLGSFSACSNVTGIVSKTRTIARLLHSHGCFACFDFAASGPYVEIDMRSGQPDGYDAIFLSPHKFMGGPGSAGVLLMTNRLYMLGSGPPSTCGGGTVEFVSHNHQDTIYHTDIEKREDAGTPGNIQKVRTALTFWCKELIGTDLISSRETVLIDTAMRRLSSNPNMKIYGSTEAKRIAVISFNTETTLSSGEESYTGLQGSNRSPNWVEGNVSPLRLFRKRGRRNPLINSIKDYGPTGNHPVKQVSSQSAPRGKPLHGRFITKLLNDLFGIQGRGGCSCAGPYGHDLLGIDDELSFSIREAMTKGWGGIKPGWARVSFGFYITTEELEFLIAAIEFVADYGQRFLQLYDFDWKTGDWTFREEYKEIVEEAEKYVVSQGKHHWWSLQSSDVTAQHHGCFSFNPPSSQALLRKLNPSHLNYMQVAECIAESLPNQPPIREIPDDLDPELVTFRV